MEYDLVVLCEHPEWQKPLFSALDRRSVRYGTFDLKRGAFDPARAPDAPLYFNQASPSAYVRGNTRAVPLALSLIRSLELGGAKVLNGSRAFSLELSKSTQAALMQRLKIPHPRTLAFNAVDGRSPSGEITGLLCSSRSRVGAVPACTCCVQPTI